MIDNAVKLREVASAQVGYQARTRLNESPDGDYIILRAQDFDEFGRLDLENAARFFAQTDFDPKKGLIAAGQILVQARGQQHCAFHIHQTLEKAVVSNAFYLIKVKDKATLDPMFLSWWINQSLVQNFFKEKQGISTIPFIALSILLDTPVVIPPMQIQKKICDLFACWQKEQYLNQELMLKREQLIRAASLRAVTYNQEVKFDR